MASQMLPSFDESTDKWNPYLIKAEAYFEANGITESSKKRALLVAALSTQTVQVLAGRVAPRKPNSLTYDEVTETLNEYYDPKRNEIAESYKFFSRSQLEGESVRAFLIEIRRIADNCNFGSSLDRMIRDRIVCGRLPVLGELELMVTYQGVAVECKLVVLDCVGPSLCGRDLINMLDKAGASVLEVAPGTVQAISHDNTRAEYTDVFSEELGLIKGPPASLMLKEGAVPKFCKARSLPYALRDKVAKELERLVSLGILSPVKHSNWATPIVPVLKKDGTVRICGDFKATLNQACETEQYPLPVIQDMFASLGGGEVFSTLDLKDAYNQVPLDEGARKLCVINTHLGLFCYNRLPFGISSAPAIFQRKMDTMLAGLPGVQAYLDDVLVSEKVADNGARLKAVLQRFREHGVKLRRTPNKSGKSPSEMLLGYQIRSRLDTCFPKSGGGATCASQERVPPANSRVHVRNYGTGSKWIPGQVIATSGTRMVTVETPETIVRRHVDQVRLQPREVQSQVSAEHVRTDEPPVSPKESVPHPDASLRERAEQQKPSLKKGRNTCVPALLPPDLEAPGA
ncbi:uncharacterized protein LOC119382240 [Rhipicephalus sanguineus]|uniref:uncharacterized protein LOC119382240 n=1 Tax=Rhipicephalus sanguineus TaxID=34632 RepID=UPI00189357C4|nr:uncharacterized protein LOC119382240 [Rhipicephalus sanguineus]